MTLDDDVKKSFVISIFGTFGLIVFLDFPNILEAFFTIFASSLTVHLLKNREKTVPMEKLTPAKTITPADDICPIPHRHI